MSFTHCPGCNGTSFHYSQRLNAIICDTCGRPQTDMASLVKQQDYYTNRTMAIRYIKANDYAGAKPYLEKMRRERPDDPDIYYLHLMGATRQCNDMMLDLRNPNLPEAEQYYSTLHSLGGDTTRFENYGRRRMEQLQIYWQDRLASYRKKTMILLGTGLTITLILFLAESWLSMLTLAGTIWLVLRSNFLRQMHECTQMLKMCASKELNSPFVHL